MTAARHERALSAAAHNAYPGFGPYVAGKTGALGLVRSMAYDWGRYGIRVNALSPTHGMSVNFAMPPEAPPLGLSYEEAAVQGIGPMSGEPAEWDPFTMFPGPLKVNRPPSLQDNANVATFLASVPLFGALSDRWGRRPVSILGALVMAAACYPFFLLVDSEQPWLIWLALLVTLGIGQSAVLGAQPAFFAELFSTKVRFTAVGVANNIGTVLTGGMAPLLASALLLWFDHSVIGVVIFLLATCAITAPAPCPISLMLEATVMPPVAVSLMVHASCEAIDTPPSP